MWCSVFIEFLHKVINKHSSPCWVGHPSWYLLRLLAPRQIAPNIIKPPRFNPSTVKFRRGEVCPLPHFSQSRLQLRIAQRVSNTIIPRNFNRMILVNSFLPDSDKLWFVNLRIKSICFRVNIIRNALSFNNSALSIVPGDILFPKMSLTYHCWNCGFFTL